MKKLALVTDSSCDVPADMVQTYGIHVIPAYINFSAHESLPDDGVSITREQFYARMKTAHPLPTTSAYSVGDAETVLRRALDQAEHVIAIHISAGLSAMYNSTRLASENLGTDRITVIDSGSLSIGAGWQVLYAARAIAQGLDREAVLRVIGSVKKRTFLWAFPDSLDYLRRSGRISNVLGQIGEVLQIKPILQANHGRVEPLSRARTSKNALAKLLQYAQAHLPIEGLALIHLDNLEGLARLRAGCASFAPPENTLEIFASSAIGVNFGPGGLGLSVVKAESPPH
jgi:DegV family protein with EDD domain